MGNPNPDTIWLQQGHLICPTNQWDGRADILIKEGKILGVFNGLGQPSQRVPEGAELVDVTGLNVSPGLVDMAVYLRSPGNEEEERLDETLMGALAGGVTTVVGLPTTDPSVEAGEDVSHRLWRAEKANAADLCVVGALSVGREGEYLADMAEMAKAGAVAFSDVDSPLRNLSWYQNACRYAAGVQTMVFGGQPIFGFGHEGVIAEGKVATRLGLKGVPEEAEVLAVTRDIEMAKLTGAQMHLGFLSSARALDTYVRARKEGVQVSAAVSPWHLMLTEDIHLERPYDTSIKFWPPLRTESDRQALCDAVKEGLLVISSGHRPVPPQEKEVEFSLATPGAMALSRYFSLLFSHAANDTLGGLVIADLVKAASALPSATLGLSDRGHLSAGQKADVMLFCPETSWMLSDLPTHGSLNNTPNLDATGKGAVQATLAQGAWAFMTPAFEKRLR